MTPREIALDDRRREAVQVRQRQAMLGTAWEVPSERDALMSATSYGFAFSNETQAVCANGLQRVHEYRRRVLVRLAPMPSDARQLGRSVPASGSRIGTTALPEGAAQQATDEHHGGDRGDHRGKWDHAISPRRAGIAAEPGIGVVIPPRHGGEAGRPATAGG